MNETKPVEHELLTTAATAEIGVTKMKSRSQRAKSKVADLTARLDLIQPQQSDLFG